MTLKGWLGSSDSKKIAMIGLIAALAGSSMAVVGQITAALIPIWLGPSSLSDFSISMDPVYFEIGINTSEKNMIFYQPQGLTPQYSSFNIISRKDGYHLQGSIEIKNAYSWPLGWLKPYPHAVFIRAINVPKGVNVSFEYREKMLPFNTKMLLSFSNPRILTFGDYPITIQGVGGDGKIRNCTYFLQISEDQPGRPKPIVMHYN
jgi:hypothetical protein